MTRAIYKTLTILLIAIIWICDLNGQSAIQRDTSKIYPIVPKSVTSLKSTSEPVDLLKSFQMQMQGCLCDPVLRNELGISMIGSLKSPTVGLGLDFNPFYFNHLKADIQFRYDFKNDFTINSGLETKYLFRKLPFDFRFEYHSYHLSKTNLTDYHKYSGGVVYRIPWTSMGLLIGQDDYQFKKNMGVEMFIKYEFHVPINKCCEPYKSVADIYTGISYWNNKVINYKIKLDYLLNYSTSIGIGYQKTYVFNELFFTIRYDIFYF